MGHGIALLDDYTYRVEIERGQLRRLLPLSRSPIPLDEGSNATFLQNEYLPGKIRAFVTSWRRTVPGRVRKGRIDADASQAAKLLIRSEVRAEVADAEAFDAEQPAGVRFRWRQIGALRNRTSHRGCRGQARQRLRCRCLTGQFHGAIEAAVRGQPLRSHRPAQARDQRTRASTVRHPRE